MGPREERLAMYYRLDDEALAREDVRAEIASARLADGLEEALGLLDIYAQDGGADDALRRLRGLLSPAPKRRTNENTGLPCEFCGERQKRLNIQCLPDGGLILHVSERVEPGKIRREVNGLRQILKSFADGAVAPREGGA